LKRHTQLACAFRGGERGSGLLVLEDVDPPPSRYFLGDGGEGGKVVDNELLVFVRHPVPLEPDRSGLFLAEVPDVDEQGVLACTVLGVGDLDIQAVPHDHAVLGGINRNSRPVTIINVVH